MTRPSWIRATLLVVGIATAGTALSGLGPARDPAGVQDPQVAQPDTSPPAVGRVTFPHERHFTELGFECKTCHHETNASALRMPHEKYFDDFWIDCQICHKSDGPAAAEPQACSNCHHGSPTSIADETLSAKVVIHQQCWGCHESGTGDAASQGCARCHVQDAGATAAPDPSAESPTRG